MDIDGKNVLICDGNDMSRCVLEIILNTSEVKRVFNFNNPILAQKHIVTEPVDLIITGNIMTEMSGFEFIDWIRDNKNINIPFILMSGFLDDKLFAKVQEEQIPFLEKPFLLDDMWSAISAI